MCYFRHYCQIVETFDLESSIKVVFCCSKNPDSPPESFKNRFLAGQFFDSLSTRYFVVFRRCTIDDLRLGKNDCNFFPLEGWGGLGRGFGLKVYQRKVSKRYLDWNHSIAVDQLMQNWFKKKKNAQICLTLFIPAYLQLIHNEGWLKSLLYICWESLSRVKKSRT